MSTPSLSRRRREWVTSGAIIVVLVALIIGLRIRDRRAVLEIRNENYVPKPAHVTPEVALLQDYVRIDTSNPPGNEVPGAKWLVAQLARGGVHAEVIESAPKRTNVYARIRGTHPGDGLILLNHIDVVPASRKGWSKPPFSAAVAANMVWGRGSADMKGMAVCELQAFLEVAGAGRPPAHDIIFLAVADEEAGSAFGVRWLLEHRPDVFEGARYVLNEGGVTELQKEKITYFGVEIGAKELTELQLVGATREQMQSARIALEPYFEPRDPDRVLPGVRAFFRSVAPLRVESVDLLSDIDRTIAAGKLWLLPFTYRDLLVNTIWASGVTATPDGHVAMDILMSNLPGVDPDERIAWLARAVAPYGVKVGTVKRKEGPIPPSPDDTPLFALIAREAKAEYSGVRVGPEVLFQSTSDSRFLRTRGLVCYGLQPFPLDYFQTLGIHGINERVRLDWFDAGVRLVRRIVKAYAFAR